MPVEAVFAQGGLGVTAGIFIWLYLGERKDHRQDSKDYQATISTLQNARRDDAVETRNEVTSILPGISQSLQNISDKITISKRSGES